MAIIIKIPTLNDELDDFVQMFAIANKCIEADEDVILDFENCTFLRPNAVAFLGGMIRKIESTERSCKINWKSFTSNAVLMNLKQNGFAYEFNGYGTGWVGNSIPYREDKIIDSDRIFNYLENKWLPDSWMSLSDSLKEDIIGSVWEIYNNVIEHSNSKIGTFSCGQHFPERKKLILTVVDFGVGIPWNVHNYLRNACGVDKINDSSAINWALQETHTTKRLRRNEPDQGIGFSILEAMISANNGSLEIYSGNGLVSINKAGKELHELPQKFSGTIVQITLNCDDRYYKYNSE